MIYGAEKWLEVPLLQRVPIAYVLGELVESVHHFAVEPRWHLVKYQWFASPVLHVISFEYSVEPTFFLSVKTGRIFRRKLLWGFFA